VFSSFGVNSSDPVVLSSIFRNFFFVNLAAVHLYYGTFEKISRSPRSRNRSDIEGRLFEVTHHRSDRMLTLSKYKTTKWAGEKQTPSHIHFFCHLRKRDRPVQGKNRDVWYMVNQTGCSPEIIGYTITKMIMGIDHRLSTHYYTG